MTPSDPSRWTISRPPKTDPDRPPHVMCVCVKCGITDVGDDNPWGVCDQCSPQDHAEYLPPAHASRLIGVLLVGAICGVTFGVVAGVFSGSWIIGLVIGGLCATAGATATATLTGGAK